MFIFTQIIIIYCILCLFPYFHLVSFFFSLKDSLSFCCARLLLFDFWTNFFAFNFARYFFWIKNSRFTFSLLFSALKMLLLSFRLAVFLARSLCSPYCVCFSPLSTFKIFFYYCFKVI